MLTLYLASLVFGGILLTISLFAGGDADSDVDHSLDAHADVDMDHSLDMHADVDMDHSLDVHADLDGGMDLDTDIELDADVGGGDLPVEIDADHPAVASVEDVEVDHHGGMLSAAFEFFSFRNLVYMTTFFGMTGSVLTWLAMPFGLTLGSSIGMGFFAGMVGHRFMKYLRGSESGQALQLQDLIGHTGKVTLPPTKERKGKILISTARENIELIALQHADSQAGELRPGDQVFILRVERDLVYIDQADFA